MGGGLQHCQLLIKGKTILQNAANGAALSIPHQWKNNPADG